MALALDKETDFHVTLGVFDGPFDLLLRLIGKHELDITQISLGQVTDEFLSYVRGLDESLGIERASEFLLVAATLLDLKIASLLPQGEVVDAEDVALLEARDLLFARLLQYRAYKEIASWFATSLEIESSRLPRAVRLEERFRDVRPELIWSLSAQEFGVLAQEAMMPREIPGVGLTHLHAPQVSIRAQADILVSKLRSSNRLSFRELLRDVAGRPEFVARFLGLLELYRLGAIAFEPQEGFSDFYINWEGIEFGADQLAELGAEFE